MERVKKGEKYWYIHLGDFGLCSMWDWEEGGIYADARYEHDNYFHTKEEADDCISKIEAVLKGADVIEMPSEGDIKAVAIRHCGPLAQWSGSTVDAFIECAEWLKSKIVK